MMITLELRVYATGVSLAARQVALGLLAAALPAQEACRAEDYFDDGYRSIVSVDFAQIRGSGVWDEMDIGAAKLLLHLVEQQLETSFEDLDRFRMVSFAGLPKAVGEEPGSNLMIVERNVPFGPPDGVVGGRLRREQRAEVERRPAPLGLAAAHALGVCTASSLMRRNWSSAKSSSSPSAG